MLAAQTVIRKGDIALKLNRLLIPVVALLLLAGAAISMGAQPKPAYRVPAGELVDSPNAASMQETPRQPVPQAPALTDAPQPGTSITSFDGSSLDGWQGINKSGVSWVARDGRLQQDIPQSEIPSEQNALFVTRDTSFVNGSVETYFYATAGSPLGIVLRGSAAGYYRVALHMNVSTNQISKAYIERISIGSNGSFKREVLGSADFSAWAGYSLEQWTLVKASTQGNRISVAINGREIVSATDSTNAYAQGWAGIWTQSDNGTQFDNIRIQRVAGR